MAKDLRISGGGCTMRPRDGRVLCPCGKTLLFIGEETTVTALPVMCRKCGAIWRIDLGRENLTLRLSH